MNSLCEIYKNNYTSLSSNSIKFNEIFIANFTLNLRYADKDIEIQIKNRSPFKLIMTLLF